MATHKLLQIAGLIDGKSLGRCASKCGYKPVRLADSDFAIENAFFRFTFHRKKTVTDVYYEELRYGLKAGEEFNRIYRSYLQEYASDRRS